MKYLNANSPILLIIGPSGAGKSSIAQELEQIGLIKVIPTWTNRPIRNDENFINHKFISSAKFEKLKEDNFFLETVKLFDLDYEYGLPKIPEVNNLIPSVILRAPLIDLFKKHYKNLIVYQIEANLEALKSRLNKRESDTNKRLEIASEETRLGRLIADESFDNSDDLSKALGKVKSSLSNDSRIKVMSFGGIG